MWLGTKFAWPKQHSSSPTGHIPFMERAIVAFAPHRCRYFGIAADPGFTHISFDSRDMISPAGVLSLAAALQVSNPPTLLALELADQSLQDKQAAALVCKDATRFVSFPRFSSTRMFPRFRFQFHLNDWLGLPGLASTRNTAKCAGSQTTLPHQTSLGAVLHWSALGNVRTRHAHVTQLRWARLVALA
jgi:hypothetical protein